MAKIPKLDVIGVTVILITCSYRDKEFIRIGYYLSNYYDDPLLNENPPAEPQAAQIMRQILADKPRVTRFEIEWDVPLNAAGGAGGDPSTSADTGAVGVSGVVVAESAQPPPPLPSTYETGQVPRPSPFSSLY